MTLAEHTDSLILDGRFNGPPTTANGGYACGAVARHVDGPAEVTLRRPPVLDTPLQVVRDAGGHVRVLEDDGALVAEARPADLTGVFPPLRPTLAEAREAMRGHPPLGHLLWNCFVCGHAREDGLGVCFGPLAAAPRMTAAVLEADATIPQHDGALAPEIVWAALDCPSYTPEVWDVKRPSLLGRMAAELLEPVPAGEPLVVVGWPLETEGRKHRSASAILDPSGRVLARARALWIRLA
jgi:hypothetical protein